MTLGPAGYGRYNDSPEHVGCPRAKSDMTPCIARDGHTALADDNVCVGCGSDPLALLEQLARAAGLSTERHTEMDEPAMADLLKSVVWDVTEPVTQTERDIHKEMGGQ